MLVKYDIFLSYPSRNRDWVNGLVEALSRDGISVWYDRLVDFGDVLIDRLQDGLRSSDYVVILLTPESVHSNWAAFELGAALALGKPIIPIVAPDTPLEGIPGPVRERKYIVQTDPEAAAREIAGFIAKQRSETAKASG